ncbi:MAG: serine/threonine protein kinase [Desulfobacteraceae bacterium 4572_19]|nr:MAG: serine/threonine protein kinase [Desulfobacteraceae bacterium 4572_19]
MIAKNRLLVIWDEVLVGTLERHTKGRVVFQYSQDWLNGFAKSISLSLPCRKEKYSPGISTAFFENLLPESDVKTVLAFNRRFNKNDTFAFFENFGEDCAGALSVLSEGNQINFSSGEYECIDNELINVLDKIAVSPEKYKLFPQMKQARLSIAGAQDKLPVYIKKNRFYLPLTSGSATTHIIKPASAILPDITKNEAFCMELAQIIGLSVPDSKLIEVGGHELFVIDRYDRKQTVNTVLRIHQEDFCQAMGLSVNRKYQESGGPGFLQCRELIDEFLSDNGAKTRLNFARVTIFNYLIGNCDAHGKNFSIIHETNLRLAPFYDLLSTQVYPLDNKFAMAIGKTYKLSRIKEHSFKEFAEHLKLSSKKLLLLMEEVTQAVNNVYAKLLTEHEKKYGISKIYDSLFKVIKVNLERLNYLRGLSSY